MPAAQYIPYDPTQWPSFDAYQRAMWEHRMQDPAVVAVRAQLGLPTQTFEDYQTMVQRGGHAMTEADQLALDAKMNQTQQDINDRYAQFRATQPLATPTAQPQMASVVNPLSTQRLDYLQQTGTADDVDNELASLLKKARTRPQRNAAGRGSASQATLGNYRV